MSFFKAVGDNALEDEDYFRCFELIAIVYRHRGEKAKDEQWLEKKKQEEAAQLEKKKEGLSGTPTTHSRSISPLPARPGMKRQKSFGPTGDKASGNTGAPEEGEKQDGNDDEEEKGEDENDEGDEDDENEN